jgi:hypothetical protein
MSSGPDWKAISALEDEEEIAWEKAGAAIRDVVSPDAWHESDLADRMRLLTTAHGALRPAFDLSRGTKLAFVTDIDGRSVGGGYDDETGTYITIVIAELARDDPAPVIAAVAHELRHAYQHEAWDELASDPRAGLWRQAREVYDSEHPGYEYGLLETDAERAQRAVGRGYTGT